MDPTIPAWGTEVTTVNNSVTLACQTETLTQISLTLLLALVGLAGNATVLWLLGFCMHRTHFSVYILNLAGADFLFLSFRLLYSLSTILVLKKATVLSILTFLLAVSSFAYLAGLSLLSAISTERCLSVLWPIWHRCQRPRHTSAVVCALLWTASLVLSLLEGGACGRLYNNGYAWCDMLKLIRTAWLIVLFVVLCVSSLALLLRVFCGSGRMPVTRLFVTLVLTVLVFLLFGLPLGIRWLVFKYIFDSYIHCSVYKWPEVLSSVNSCANPIIYFFVGSFRHRRSQRRTLKLILQRAMRDTPEEGESGDRGPLRSSRELETVSSRC